MALTPTLLLDLTTAREGRWRAALERSGVHLGAACDGHNLVQRTMTGSATQLVCLASGITPELVAALAGWDGEPSLSVLLLTPPAALLAADAELAVACGIHHCQTLSPDAAGAIAAVDVESALALSRARHRHDTALRRVAQRAHEELGERKWVDRAKGVLMSARGLG
jgi:hypothetical protein